MIGPALLGVCVVLAAVPGAATTEASPPAASGPPSVLVMDMTSDDAELGRLVTQLVTAELAQRYSAKVLSTVDVRRALALEEQKQLVGCDEASCLVEIAGALGADQVVFGDIVQLDTKTLITLNLLDVRAAQSKGRAVIETVGRDDLPRAVQRGVAALTGASSGPNAALLFGGLAAAGVGAVIGAGALITAVLAEGVRTDPASKGSDKDAAALAQIGGGVALVAAVVVVIAGVSVAASSLLVE